MAITRIKLKINYGQHKAGDTVNVTPEVLAALRLDQYEPLGTLMTAAPGGKADIEAPVAVAPVASQAPVTATPPAAAENVAAAPALARNNKAK